jgi:uncharacterized UBP type Zn finger protein
MKEDSNGKVRLGTKIREIKEEGSLPSRACAHLDQVVDVVPSAEGCEDCLKTGDRWVHLRLCLSCGYVGCCDNSKNRHGTRHFKETGHPMIVSYEPGETWMWCYEDKNLIDLYR